MATAPRRICGHVLPQKRRRCKFEAVEGAEFCRYHLPNDFDPSRLRIPCPIDPHHTIYAKDLDRHVAKCPFLPYVPANQPYYVEDVNAGGPADGDGDGSVDLKALPADRFHRLAAVVRDLHARYVAGQVETEVLAPDLGMALVADGAVAKARHAAQQASLAGHLQRLGLLSPAYTYLEFGAGRGGLSLLLSKVAKGCHNVLIDRRNFKRKADSTVRFETQFQRLYVDIKDLSLAAVPALRGRTCVAVSKHLCGAATDLTLRCLTPASTGGPAAPAGPTPPSNSTAPACDTTSDLSPDPIAIRGVAIALCCHHACRWRPYVGRPFLEAHGVDAEDFTYLCRLSSWGCCGWRDAAAAAADPDEGEEGATSAPPDPNAPAAKRPRVAPGDPTGDEHATAAPPDDDVTDGAGGGGPSPGVPWWSWSPGERRRFGLQVKRVLDMGRVAFLRAQGYQCRLVYYVPEDCSPENALLLCWRDGPSAPAPTADPSTVGLPTTTAAAPAASADNSLGANPLAPPTAPVG